MLFYTIIFSVSLLVAVPIIILIFQTISSVNKSASDLSCDELVAATGRMSGQNYRATQLKLHNARGSIQRNPDSAEAFRE